MKTSRSFIDPPSVARAFSLLTRGARFSREISARVIARLRCRLDALSIVKRSSRNKLGSLSPRSSRNFSVRGLTTMRRGGTDYPQHPRDKGGLMQNVGLRRLSGVLHYGKRQRRCDSDVRT